MLNFGLSLSKGRKGTGVLSAIRYTMDRLSTTLSAYLVNDGYTSNLNNADLFSNRHLVLDATQELPIEVPHTLGADSKQGTLSGSFTSAPTSTVIDLALNSFSTNSVVKVVFTVTNMTEGAFFIREPENIATPLYIANGTYEALITIGAVLTNRLDFRTNAVSTTCDITVDSIQEVTTTANTAITHWDATANEYVQLTSGLGFNNNDTVIINGDFSNGITGWGGVNVSVINERAYINAITGSGYLRYSSSLTLGERYVFTFDLDIVTAGDVSLEFWGGPVVATYSESGTYTVVAEDTGADGSFLFGRVAGHSPQFYIDNVFVKKLLPVSTTYTFTNQSVGEIAPTTTPFTAADRALMNADNQLLGQLKLGSTTTGLSLVTADLYGYYPVSELSGEFVVDTTNISSELFDTESYGTSGTGNTVSLIGTTYSIHNEIATGSTLNPIVRAESSVGVTDALYIHEFIATVTSGTALLNRLGFGDGSGGDSVIELNQTMVQGDIYTFIGVKPYRTTTGSYLAFDGLTQDVFDATVEISLREANQAEITNYAETVRTNGDQSTNGMQLVGFKQDSLGLPTAVADAGTTQWTNDGRTATTGWTITAPFIVTEVVDGVAYTFTSDANRYAEGVADGTYTIPKGVWALNNTAYDAVTSITTRGDHKMDETVVKPERT